MSDPSRNNELTGSYEDGVKMIEQVLDSRSALGAVPRAAVPASSPISFGDSELPKTTTSGAQPALRTSNQAKKETSLKDSKEGSKTAPAAVATSSASGDVAAAEPGAAKKSKNQMKKENRGQTNQKYWDEVAAGLRPDPRIAREQKSKELAEAGEKAHGKASGAAKASGEGGAKGKKGGAKATASDAAQGDKSGAQSSHAKSTASSGAASGSGAKGSAKGAASSAATSSASAASMSGSVELDRTKARGVPGMQTSLQFDDPKRKASAKKKQILARVQTPRQLDLFSHMKQSETYEGTVSDAILQNHADIPAQFVTYGLQLASKRIQGSNARNLGLIDAFMGYLETFMPHPSKPFHVDLDRRMKPLVQYVVDSRPLSIGQSNIIDFLKRKMSELGSDVTITTTEEARKFLIRQLKTFKDVHILGADLAIQEKVSSKIQDRDVILTFGRSYIVSKSLKDAALKGKKFKVIVLDANPRFEGVRTLQELADLGIELEYSYLHAISYFMKGITKVLVGASGVTGNGQLYSRAGTSIVCMMAHTYRVPVLVACETYKFSEKVQLDAITKNEVDDPDLLNKPNLVGHTALKNWKSLPKLKMLNLVYDLTPSEFIDMIITEHGPVPSTSVPALIREFHSAI